MGAYLPAVLILRTVPCPSRVAACARNGLQRVCAEALDSACAHLPTYLCRYITYKELLQAIRRTDPAMAEEKIKVRPGHRWAACCRRRRRRRSFSCIELMRINAMRQWPRLAALGTLRVCKSGTDNPVKGTDNGCLGPRQCSRFGGRTCSTAWTSRARGMSITPNSWRLRFRSECAFVQLLVPMAIMAMGVWRGWSTPPGVRECSSASVGVCV